MSGEPPPVGPDPADEPVPPVGPGPAGEPVLPSSPPAPDWATPDGAASAGDDGTASDVVENSLVSPSPSPAPPVAGAPVPWQGPPAVDPATEPARPGVHWALVLVGVPIGFVAWVVASLLILGLTSSGSSSTSLAVAVLVVLLVAPVGLIVWRRTRRLGQGFVLGLAIGLVVAGGLCIPLVTSLGGF